MSRITRCLTIRKNNPVSIAESSTVQAVRWHGSQFGFNFIHAHFNLFRFVFSWMDSLKSSLSYLDNQSADNAANSWGYNSSHTTQLTSAISSSAALELNTSKHRTERISDTRKHCSEVAQMVNSTWQVLSTSKNMLKSLLSTLAEKLRHKCPSISYSLFEGICTLWLVILLWIQSLSKHVQLTDRCMWKKK